MAAPADEAVDASDDDGKGCTCGSNHEQGCLYCRRKRSSASGLPSSSSSCSLLSFDSYPVQDYDKMWRVFTASVKGFSIGAGIKGGLALFALLTRIRRRRSLPSYRKVEMSSGGADVVLALKETLRYGLFLGTFAGTFVSVDEIITSLGGHRRTAKWRALLAGAIAGPSMLLTGLNTQHTSLAIYILMRATVLASRCGIKSNRFGHICKPLTWSYGDILLMCLSSSQILSAYILKQNSLPSSYKSFLNKHGAKDPIILNGVREIACGLPFTNLEAIEKYYKSMGVEIKLDPTMKVPCSLYGYMLRFKEIRKCLHLKFLTGNQPIQNELEPPQNCFRFGEAGPKIDGAKFMETITIGAIIAGSMTFFYGDRLTCNIIHGNQACAAHFFSFLLQAYKRALPVYLPVYLIPALIVHRQGVLKRPHTIIWKGLFGTARSSLFLSMYCSSAWIWTCFLFRIFKKCDVPMVAIGTFPTGLALAIEKKSRRIEISLYCLARAIESFSTCMSDLGYLTPSKNFKRADVLVFSISTAIIMHCYAMERDVFRSKYLNVLDWVFGIPLPPYETTPRKMRRCATTEF